MLHNILSFLNLFSSHCKYSNKNQVKKKKEVKTRGQKACNGKNEKTKGVRNEMGERKLSVTYDTIFF